MKINLSIQNPLVKKERMNTKIDLFTASPMMKPIVRLATLNNLIRATLEFPFGRVLVIVYFGSITTLSTEYSCNQESPSKQNLN